MQSVVSVSTFHYELIPLAPMSRSESNRRHTLIALDDEPLALRLLERYLEQFPEWNLLGTFTDAATAADFLRSNPADLLLLDINMPDITGLQFVRQLPEEHPLVIFITAYQEHALEGFELDVIDYLLKPIAPDRFRQALQRAEDRLDLLRKAETSIPVTPASEYLYVYSEYQQIKITISDILYVESMGDYVKIFLAGKEKPIITLQRLKGLALELEPYGIRRIHRSYLANLHQIEARQKARVKIADQWLPVGETYWKNIGE